MDDPDGYLELFRTIHAAVDALVYPTYPNGETVDRYKHVKALMEDPACGLEIAPIIAGSADLTPPLEYARRAAPVTTGCCTCRCPTSSTNSSSRASTGCSCRTT